MNLFPEKTPLPIDSYLPQLTELVGQNSCVVVVAEPGAGKTTRVPPAMLKTTDQKVLVLQPRRMAALAAAHRVADENAWQVGQGVGYQVRYEKRLTKQTRLIFMTEAVLLRRMLNDAELRDVGVVIIDEFHLRSLHADLAAGLISELQQLGSNLRLVIMSATLAEDQLARFWPQAPVLRIPGRTFPIEIHHQKEPLRLQTDSEWVRLVSGAIQMAWKSSQRSVLTFLPGMSEIRRVERLLRESSVNFPRIDILHGSLSLGEQTRVLNFRDETRRLVLATNVAETSITLDGIDCVVDTGLARQATFHLQTGFSELGLTRVSLASARQRSGRSGRQSPGRCFRLWSRPEEASFRPFDPPAVQREDLTDAVLYLANLGVSDPRSFSWLEAPSPAQLEYATEQLKRLGAINASGQITATGRSLAQLPLSLRSARVFLAGAELGQIDFAADLATLLESEDFLRGDRAPSDESLDGASDLMLRWQIWRQRESQIEAPRAKLEELSTSILEYAEVDTSSLGAAPQPPDPIVLAKLLAAGFSDRLCHRRGVSDRARLTSGRGSRLNPRSVVRKAEFFFALRGEDRREDSETRIDWAHGLSREEVLATFANQIRERRQILYDEDREQFYALTALCLEDLPLETGRRSSASSSEVQNSLIALALSRRATWPSRNPALQNWLRRWSWFVRRHPEAESEWSLSEAVWREAILPLVQGETRLMNLFEKDIAGEIEAQMPYGLRQSLKQAAPATLNWPGNRAHPVLYSDNPDAPAGMELRLRELFGTAIHPRIDGGRESLVLTILGPHGRPIQVTSDLPGFWQGSYHEVRKELRSRYPKHPWPENPGHPSARAHLYLSRGNKR